MNSKNKLPRDLIAYKRNRILRRVLPCVLLILLFLGALLLWRDTLLPDDKDSARTVLYVLAILLPFLLTGVPWKLLDFTYWGSIERIDVESSVEFQKGASRRWYYKNTFLLTVRTDSGRVIQRKGIATTQKLEHKMGTYVKGDRVFHLYGSPHIVVFPTAAEHTLICPVCGSLNDLSHKVCKDCRHTLIKQ